MGDLHRERGKIAVFICLSFYDMELVCASTALLSALYTNDKVSFVSFWGFYYHGNKDGSFQDLD